MLLRVGPGGGVFGAELCVACALRVVEKAVRPRCAFRDDEVCMRGRRKDGRRSAMASLGLYMAAMIAEVNALTREAFAVKMRRWSSCELRRCGPRPRLRAACGGGPKFWVNNALKIKHSTLQHPVLSIFPRAPIYHCSGLNRGDIMASNKKSGLTGYLPDILMAAAAVRSLRRVACDGMDEHAETSSNTFDSR
jgi:hypothetical protein